MKKIIPFILLSLLGCSNGQNKPVVEPFKWAGYETSDTNYFNGQILYPDYVQSNYLVVKDAAMLNWCMENYDISCDGDILDVLDAYCEVLPINTVVLPFVIIQ